MINDDDDATNMAATEAVCGTPLAMNSAMERLKPPTSAVASARGPGRQAATSARSRSAPPPAPRREAEQGQPGYSAGRRGHAGRADDSTRGRRGFYSPARTVSVIVAGSPPSKGERYGAPPITLSDGRL